MGLFSWFKSRHESVEQEINSNQVNTLKESKGSFNSNVDENVDEKKSVEKIEFEDLKFEDGEIEEVSAIFAACMAGAGTNVKYRIKSIKKVDPDLEAAAVIAASCFAGSKDGVKLKISNVYRVK